MYNEMYGYICSLSQPHPEKLVVAHYPANHCLGITGNKEEKRTKVRGLDQLNIRDQEKELAKDIRSRVSEGCGGGNLAKV